MANITTYQGGFAQPGLVLIAGTIQGNGEDAPTVVEGKGFTASRTSEGLYKIALSAKYAALVACLPGLQAATPADLQDMTVTADTLVANQTIEFRVWDTDAGGGGAAEAVHDLTTTQYLHFLLVLRNTSVNVGS